MKKSELLKIIDMHDTSNKDGFWASVRRYVAAGDCCEKCDYYAVIDCCGVCANKDSALNELLVCGDDCCELFEGYEDE